MEEKDFERLINCITEGTTLTYKGLKELNNEDETEFEITLKIQGLYQITFILYRLHNQKELEVDDICVFTWIGANLIELDMEQHYLLEYALEESIYNKLIENEQNNNRNHSDNRNQI